MTRSPSLPIRDFMTPSPVTAAEGANIDELGRLMKEARVRHIPILRCETVVKLARDNRS
jgi:CBS domain-containing protein